ncbi:MAG: hypothetical protein LBE76_00175 [Nitrososphaerota archaeon]|nr:hypothetical protein [Nitrososphaerota archaeon]
MIDQLVACLLGSSSCVEITVKADPNAVLNIQKFVYKKTSHNSSVGKVVVDQGIGFIGEAVGQTQKPLTIKTGYSQIHEHKTIILFIQSLKHKQV